jgi:hypothetical protein
MSLCLCLGSLVILPLINIVGLPVQEIFEPDSENYDPFDQVESDEEFLIVNVIGATMAGLIFSKFGQIFLDFLSAHLSPRFPPPKHA